MDITNYVKVSQTIHTSGQPKQEQFKLIAGFGVNTVINLAMPDSDSALSNEGELVTQEGMNYVHIPVVWQNPEKEKFDLFASIMASQQNQIVWVHCALNWRVSSFIYLYKTKCLGISRSVAREALEKIWQPNEVWEEFMNKCAGPSLYSIPQ